MTTWHPAPADDGQERTLPYLECGLPECRARQHRSGMCAEHYDRWLKTGDPLPSPEDPRFVFGQGAAELVGVTYRKLDYWLSVHGLLGPEVALTGSGNKRQIRRTSLPVLHVFARLTEIGLAHAVVSEIPHQRRLRVLAVLRKALADG